MPGVQRAAARCVECCCRQRLAQNPVQHDSHLGEAVYMCRRLITPTIARVPPAAKQLAGAAPIQGSSVCGHDAAFLTGTAWFASACRPQRAAARVAGGRSARMVVVASSVADLNKKFGAWQQHAPYRAPCWASGCCAGCALALLHVHACAAHHTHSGSKRLAGAHACTLLRTACRHAPPYPFCKGKHAHAPPQPVSH